MKETKFIRDIPVGILIIVLAQFVFYGVIYLAKFPNFWELVGIVFFTLITSDMMNFGFRLIKGFEVDKSD